MSLILEALRKLEKQRAFPRVEESNIETSESSSEVDRIEAADPDPRTVPATAFASAEQSDEPSVDLPAEQEEFGEDYNIPATDHAAAEPSLDTWAKDILNPLTTAGTTVESHSEHANAAEAADSPLFDNSDTAVPDEDLLGEASIGPADVAPAIQDSLPKEWLSPAVAAETPTEDEYAPETPAPFYDPVVQSIDLGEAHEFYDSESDDQRTASYELGEVTSIDESEHDHDAHVIYDNEPASEDPLASAPGSHQSEDQSSDFGSEHIPWATLPNEYLADELHATGPSDLPLAEDDAAAGGQNSVFDSRTIDQIEQELNHCDDLAQAIVGGSDDGIHNVLEAHVDSPIDETEDTQYADPHASEPSSEFEADVEYAQEDAEETDTVAPSDFERQILERLTNAAYEKRFTDVYGKILELVGREEHLSVAVVAPHQSEAASRFAAHLAVIIASNQSKRVQLVDASEAHYLSEQFGHEGKSGLRGACDDGSFRDHNVSTSIPTLQFMPAGIVEPGELGDFIAGNLTGFETTFCGAIHCSEVTVVDAGNAGDIAIKPIAAICDITILIADIGTTEKEQLLSAEQLLVQVGAHKIACVVSGEFATRT
ncbi:MAG: hypothetical protein KDB27_07420 [Planctomycetales bacterium]|nr:hypothetical protein [Planctomycetales bacterium]